MDELYEAGVYSKLRQSQHETAEIQLILSKLEAMEQMDDSQELENEIMETISQYPELMTAMKDYNQNNSFEKEKVEYERLKLEEQISMLEKVIEEGIKQTTELQEIHHSEVEDLHKQIINLQKQVANHVRFIDDHCVDSEEIRTDMQRDIDRLVSQLEDQEKSSRTSQSLQSQVQRLEGELAELTVKLAHAADGERRAQEQLSTRNEEQAAEVSDLQNEVSWFRGEYDQLLKKLNTCEEQLTATKNELNRLTKLTEEQNEKLQAQTTTNESLQNELTSQCEKENEKIEILNIDLEAAKSVSETQKTELEYLKAELEKSKEIITKLRTAQDYEQYSEIDVSETHSRKSSFEVSSLSDEMVLPEYLPKMNKMKEKLAYLEQKLEKKSNAFNDLKRENLRLKDCVERRKRTTFKKGNDKMTKSMNDLSKQQYDRVSNEEYDSEESGYVASQIGGSYQHIQSASSLLSLDQQSDSTPIRRQLRRAGSQHQIDEGQLSSSSTSPIQNRKPMMTSTPKKKLVTKCVECCNKSATTEYTTFNSERFLPESKYEHQEKKDSCTMKVQTDTPITHSIRCQASPRMVTSSVQTLDMNNKTEITRQPSFNPEHYLPKHHSASPVIRHTTTTHPDHTSRLEGKLNESREEVKELRTRLRERDEAYSRQNAEIAILKRQLREQEREMSRTRRLAQSTSYQPVGHQSNDADIAINLQDGDHDDYGKIDQIQPGQIQELKTVRKTVKNVNGIPIAYSTKVSVKCQKVAVFF